MNELTTISIKTIKGIGDETAQALEDMHIHSVHDLLEHFPYRYEDYELKDLAEAKHDEKVTVEGKVHSVPRLRITAKTFAPYVSAASKPLFDYGYLF